MKRLAWPLAALAASLFIAPVAQAAGMIMVDPVAGGIAMLPPVRPPVPIVHPPVHPPVRPTHPPVIPTPPHPVLHGAVTYGLHLGSESVRVEISDQVAKTYISQTFVNESDRNLAGTYLFPLPEDTTFSSFSLHIDGKPVEGKILEANEARQQYEEIVRRMVDPGLLEYADYKTVRARIFPIPAHGTKKVELEYTQVLRAENGMLKYRFPLKSEGQSEPADEIKVDVKLASKQGLRTIWSPSHTISSTKSDDHHAKVAYLAHNTVPDKDFYLYYSVSDKDLAANLITNKVSGDDGYFLLTLTPPVETKQVVGKDLVLVADTSGSMAGEKMDENKKALSYVVNALNANDRFNIVEFNTDVERFKTQLVAATPENKKAALTFIKDLEAHGGTNLSDALHNAASILKEASERPAYIVLMTDGEPTVGETSVSSLLKSIPSQRDIRLFDFGVGYDVNTKLLNKLAEMHHGTSQYIEPQEDMETALSNFYNKIKSPVLTDVKITYQGIEAKNIYPKEVTDLFAGSQALLIGRYKGSGAAKVSLTGKVNGVAKAYSFPLTFASEESDHTYLPRLWAMRRIGYLTEVAQDNGDNREVVDEIVSLSKKYGIISAYTSFLVTDPSENHRLPPAPLPGTAMSAARPMPAPVAAFAGGAGGAVFGDDGRTFAGKPKASHGATVRGALAYKARNELQIASNSPVISDFREARGFADSVGFAPPPPASTIEVEMKKEVARSLNSASTTGRDAVARSRYVQNYKTMIALDSDRAKDSGVKTIEDKTFYLKDGFWTDSDFDSGNKAKIEVVKFGSERYFDLLRTTPGISKYLAAGKQVILVFKGHTYKIVEAGTTTG
jgi:Ca-activated chloride channel family protein